MMVKNKKNKKILLVWSDDCEEPSLGFQCRKALLNLGYDVQVFNFRKFQFHRFGISNILLNKLLVKSINSYDPDMVLVDKGDSILPGTLKKIDRQNKLIVNWCLDEPFGKFGRFNKVNNIEEYDVFLMFDKYYSELLTKKGINAPYLPVGGDPDIHREIIPVNKREYICDLSFIGSHHPNREKLLQSIADLNIKIWGYRWYDVDKNSPLYPKIQKTIIKGNRSIQGAYEMCKYFNLSKINLNVHHAQAVKGGVNLRLFEISLTNSFMMSDYQEGIEKLFKLDKEIVCFQNASELRKLANYYLENEEERLKIAKAAQKRSLQDHKIIDRMKELIKLVKL
jgi:spore maturation protein CgeB